MTMEIYLIQLAQLAQRLPHEKITENDIAEWINADKQLEVISEVIVEEVTAVAEGSESDRE